MDRDFGNLESDDDDDEVSEFEKETSSYMTNDGPKSGGGDGKKSL